MEAPGAIPLNRNLPKWWSKIEIYESDLEGPALVIDLDTVFVRPLMIRPEHENRAIAIRDPWRDGSKRAERLGGGFMYLPRWARQKLVDAFDPGLIGQDDQPFVHAVLSDTALRFQDHYLDEVVSYKAQVRALGLQPDNRAIYFHGIPRPWSVSEPWIPLLETNAKSPSQEIA